MSQTPTQDTVNFNEKLTIKDLYEQGSKCCQQYSQLTMQVRTLAQHIMIAYAVGMGIFLTNRGSDAPPVGLVFFGAGIILILFAFVLCLLNLHHSFAFRAIRDGCLIELEKSCDNITGPWQAHASQRSKDWKSTDLAWYAPFVALGLIGVISLELGAWLRSEIVFTGIAHFIAVLSILGIAITVSVKFFRQRRKGAAKEFNTRSQVESK